MLLLRGNQIQFLLRCCVCYFDSITLLQLFKWGFGLLCAHNCVFTRTTKSLQCRNSVILKFIQVLFVFFIFLIFLLGYISKKRLFIPPIPDAVRRLLFSTILLPFFFVSFTIYHPMVGHLICTTNSPSLEGGGGGLLCVSRSIKGSLLHPL